MPKPPERRAIHRTLLDLLQRRAEVAHEIRRIDIACEAIRALIREASAVRPEARP
jgi:hypothetical protein